MTDLLAKGRAEPSALWAWARWGNVAQGLIALAAAGVVLSLGIYGYFVEAKVRIGFSVPQVGSVLFAMIAITAIDVVMYRNAQSLGEIRWGQIHPVSQYVLIFLAVTFTWLMGLMGYVRSGLREDWHVYGALRDTSEWAWTPTNAVMARVVGGIVVAFLAIVAAMFWLATLGKRPAR